MINQKFLNAGLDAVRAMGGNVKDINNPVINSIVDTYSHKYTTPEDVIKNHDVDNRDFTVHDNLMANETAKLTKILKACKVVWDGEVKPLAQRMIADINSKITTTTATETVDMLEVRNIVQDPIFADKLDIEKYPVHRLSTELLSLSFSCKQRNLDEISKLIVESKAANPQAIIEYLAELPPDLLTDTYNEVFVGRNQNNFLPLNFRVKDTDYMDKIVYGDYNLDKLYLTIMIACYLVDHPDDECAAKTLTEYEEYYNALINATCSLAGEWTAQLQKFISSKIVVPYSYMRNGILHINLVANLLKNVDVEGISMDNIIALCHMHRGESINLDMMNDENLARINDFKYLANYRKNKEMENSIQSAIEYVLIKDGDDNGFEYGDLAIYELKEHEELYQKVLCWIALTRYKDTYINRLIQIYISLSTYVSGGDVDSSENTDTVDLLNGMAMARLAAYIVTH